MKLNVQQLFIFDMDGLMLDTEWIYYQAWNRLLAADGYQLQFEFYKMLIGSPDHTLKDKYVAEFGPEFPFAYYLQQYKRESGAMMAEQGIPVKPGLVELLDALTQKGIKKAVATSSPRASMQKLLQDSNVYHYFDYSLCGDELRHGKPNPEIFQRILAMTGRKPQEAIVLEDSINGIQAAAAAGIHCIFVKDMVEPGPDVLALTYASLQSLSEVIPLLP